MPRLRRAVSLAVVVGAIGAGLGSTDAAAQPDPVPAGCVAGLGAAGSASALLGPGVRVKEIDGVSGFASALVSVPVTVPGARHRLLEVDGMWCDALAGFNAAVDGGADPQRIAELFTSVAAARYFDGVTVTDSRLVRPDRVEVRTHARTNGVVVDWTVDVDRHGVVGARWTAEEFAVAPFEAEIQGPTALPAASLAYRRATDGRIVTVDDPIDATVAETAAELPAGASVVIGSDGFPILVTRGHAPYVYLEQRTGIHDVDVLALAVRGTRENYEAFLSWGLSGSWTGDIGNVFIDGGIAAWCMACVLRSSVFNVHMDSRVVYWAEELGYTFTDHDLGFMDILGHEVFHNFQNSYGGRDLSGFGGLSSPAYVEGLARFQETIHTYSHTNHQPGSIIYADGFSGCNGYLENDGMAGGVGAHSYAACYVWFSVYADHGVAGIKSLLEVSDEEWSLPHAITRALGEPLADTAASFAVKALTGEGLVWGPAVGDGESLDWSQYLRLWDPPVIGRPVQVDLWPTGVTGFRILTETTLELAVDAGTRALLVRSGPEGTTTASVADDDFVAAPATDEDVWVVVANGLGRTTVTIGALEGDGDPPPPALRLGPLTGRGSASAITPFQATDWLADVDPSAMTFDLVAEASDDAVSSLVSAYAQAEARVTGTIELEPGDYAVVARLSFSGVEFESRRALGSTSAWGDASLYLRCDSYDPDCVASDWTMLRAGDRTLIAGVSPSEPTRLEIDLRTYVGASSSGGYARATATGRIVEIKVVKL